MVVVGDCFNSYLGELVFNQWGACSGSPRVGAYLVCTREPWRRLEQGGEWEAGVSLLGFLPLLWALFLFRLVPAPLLEAAWPFGAWWGACGLLLPPRISC